MNKRQKQLKIKRHEERKLDKLNNQQAEMAFELLTVLSVYTLHEKFGFGARRIERFLTELYTVSNKFSGGEVSISTLANIIDADTGIKYEEDTRMWRIGE